MHVRLSTGDLARISLSAGADPGIELRFSLRMLRGRPHPLFAKWRDSLPPRLDLSPQAYQRVAITPWWGRIETLINADRVKRYRTLLDGGLDALLSTLHPAIRWRRPVLELTPADGVPAEVGPSGHGLLLQPSVFLWDGPVVQGGSTTTLIYPVSYEIGDPCTPDGLSGLIGRSRATMLTRLTHHAGATSSDLARETGLTLAAVSQHLDILRKSGMVVTQAAGRSRLHSLTPAGLRLVRLSQLEHRRR